MTLKNLKVRLAAFGLAMAVGLLFVGNAVSVYASEGTAGQRETTIQGSSISESVSVPRRVVAKDIVKGVRDRSFSVGTCLEGIQFDPEKDDVSFNKVIGDDGSEYQSGKAGTYTAAYLVTPKDGTECYVVTRKITVTETEGTAQVSGNGGQKQKTDTEPEKDADSKNGIGSEEDPDSKKENESKEDTDSKKDEEPKDDTGPKKDEESKDDADQKRMKDPRMTQIPKKMKNQRMIQKRRRTKAQKRIQI